MPQELTSELLKEIVQLIFERHGYDFRHYAEASLNRRMTRFLQISGTQPADLRYHITNDKSFFFWMLESLTVNVTEMFRDPMFYKSLVDKVLPILDTYPLLKIWHAGCATGEEVYSMAIILHEAGLLERTRIYATDINMANIKKAGAGIMSLEKIKEYTANYRKAGGAADFSDYYTARYDHAIINKQLTKNVLFSQHNLVTDNAFNEFQLVCCRNVMIYFDKELQNRVLNLFYQSLAPRGYLALGTKESLLFYDGMSKFEVIDDKNKIFRLKIDG